MLLNKFQGKKIAILGLSVEGLSSFNYLYKKGACLTLLDQRIESKFKPSVLNQFKNKDISVILGSHYLDNLNKFDLIVRTPGFPLWNQYLQKAAAKGIAITSHIKLFFSLCPGKIIGVTGTKGKGTTATLIYNIIQASEKKAFLGGNIGIPPLSFLDKVTSDSWVILELSSFQLTDLNISPHLVVILNITSDHLYSSSLESPNYHLSQNEYLNSKINLLRYQQKSDYAVLNYDYKSCYDLRKYTKGKIWLFSKEKKINLGAYVRHGEIILSSGSNIFTICNVSEIQLRGSHNLENITAAITASYLAGISPKDIRLPVVEFKGLEYRLEFVREINGVKFYNDSFSTTPETAIAAIKSFKEPKILVCGGSEKGSDYTNLGQEILQTNVKEVILIGQTGPKIEKSIRQAAVKLKRPLPEITVGSEIMEEIVQKAYLTSKKGDVILLSPGCASFDLFKNYKERGFLFKKAVEHLI